MKLSHTHGKLNRLKGQDGSTLMLVVITIAVLTMLGTALLAMSLMNVNMKANDYRIKKTVYYAESGIDQVYARVGKLVEQAIQTAITNTDNDLKNILQVCDDIVSDEDPVAYDAPYHYIGLYLTAELQLDTDQLQTYAENQYKTHFRTALDSLDVHTVLTADAYEYLDSNDPSNNSEIDIEISNSNIVTFATNSNPHEFVIKDIKSTFALADHTEKVIKTDIVISDEVSSYPMNTIEERIVVTDNPLWQQALVAVEDIDVNGGDVTITGNIYGYGTVPANLADTTAFGGVSVRNDGDLEVTGDIYTRSFVQLAAGTAGDYNSGNLTVNNGLVYANSVVVQNYASGDMNISGNVYTSDDLELNGTGTSSIIINGSYYGYTDGSSTDASTTHDKSSAIVINADMTQATLSVNGVQPAGVDINRLESTPGVLIGGTAYVNSQPTRYQTAESVSIKGNYVAYTWGFDRETIDTIKTGNDFMATPYDFYGTESTHDTRVENFLFQDNVAWLDITGTTAKFANGSTVAGAGNITLQDRMAYFSAFSEFVDNGTGTFLKLSSNTHLSLKNYIYTTGIQIDYDGASGRNKFIYDPSSAATYDTLRIKISKDYLYQLHKMSYRDGTEFDLNDMVNVDQNILEKVAGGQAPSIDNINVVEKYTKLDTDTYNYASIVDIGSGIREVKIVNNSMATLHIYGGSTPVAESATEKYIGSLAQGIIVHNGDVVIHNDVDLNGVIIANGTISVEGGNVTIHNSGLPDMDYLARLIYDDNVLYDVFDVHTYGGTGTDPVYLDDIEYLSVDYNFNTYDPSDPDSINSPRNNSLFMYSDWIRFENWQIVQ